MVNGHPKKLPVNYSSMFNDGAAVSQVLNFQCKKQCSMKCTCILSAKLLLLDKIPLIYYSKLFIKFIFHHLYNTPS